MDNPIQMTSASPATDWLVFLAILIPACLVIGAFVVWFVYYRQGSKRRRKRHKHHHHRKTNPTLAETGGLPPMRNPGEPPHGI